MNDGNDVFEKWSLILPGLSVSFSLIRGVPFMGIEYSTSTKVQLNKSSVHPSRQDGMAQSDGPEPLRRFVVLDIKKIKNCPHL